MFIKKGKYGNTGNSVGNYGWGICICDYCNGEGKVYSSIEEKEIICPECDGRGQWEEKY